MRRRSLLFLQGRWWLAARPHQRGGDRVSRLPLCCFSGAFLLGAYSHTPPSELPACPPRSEESRQFPAGGLESHTSLESREPLERLLMFSECCPAPGAHAGRFSHVISSHLPNDPTKSAP